MKYKETVLDYSKGIWNHNRNVELSLSQGPGWFNSSGFGTQGELGNAPGDIYALQETPPGYFDEILNFKFDERGHLVSREGADEFFPLNGGPGGTAYWCNSGRYTYPNQFNEESFILSGNDSGTFRFFTGTVQNSGLALGLVGSSVDANITAIGNSLSPVRYNKKYYFYANSSTAGVIYDSDTGLFTYSAAIPGMGVGGCNNGVSPFIFKDRAWLLGGFPEQDTIRYSKATDPFTFTSPDGGSFSLPNKVRIKDIIPFKETIYIIDVIGNIWTFNYSVDPGTDGFLQQLTRINNPEIINSNADSNSSFAVSNDSLFVCDTTAIYVLVNRDLIPISDALFMKHRDACFSIWDIGYGLLAVVHEAVDISGGQRQMVSFYVFHHSVGAWTKYHMNYQRWSEEGSENRPYQLTSKAIRLGDSWVLYSINLIDHTSSGLFFRNVAGGSIFDEPKAIVDGYYRNSQLVTKTYETPFYRLTSGLHYLDEDSAKDFKYVRFILLEAFLAYQTENGAADLTPFRWTVEFVPSGIANKVDSVLQALDDSAKYVEPYKLPVMQRLRGFRFKLEKDGFDTTAGAVPTNLIGKLFIERLAVLWTPVGGKRRAGYATANTDKSAS